MEVRLFLGAPWLLMPNILIISDTHFFHRNLVTYCGRPKDFELKIEKGLRMVNPEDTLIHLGDIAMGNDLKAHERFIMPLACKKILIRGNHDKKSDNWYLNHGWNFVVETFSGKYFNKKILFSHLPQKDDGSFDFNIFGHFHNTNFRKYEPEMASRLTPKHHLFALEYNDYKPIKLVNMLYDGPDKNL